MIALIFAAASVREKNTAVRAFCRDTSAPNTGAQLDGRGDGGLERERASGDADARGVRGVGKRGQIPAQSYHSCPVATGAVFGLTSYPNGGYARDACRANLSRIV